MRFLLCLAIAFSALEAAAAAQVGLQSDTLHVSGEMASGSSVRGGGGTVDWVHPTSPQSMLTAGAASMRVGSESWTYGTLGGVTRRGKVWLIGSVGLGEGQRGSDAHPYVRVAGAATLPVVKSLSVETEGQLARLNGTPIKVVKAGALYGGIRKTSLRAAYIGASDPFQYWHYLFVRGDVTWGRAGVLGGLTAGRAPTSQSAIGPGLLLHTSQEVFGGGSFRVHDLRTTGIVQSVRQISGRFSRVMVTLQVPLRSRAGAAAGGAK